MDILPWSRQAISYHLKSNISTSFDEILPFHRISWVSWKDFWLFSCLPLRNESLPYIITRLSNLDIPKSKQDFAPVSLIKNLLKITSYRPLEHAGLVGSNLQCWRTIKVYCLFVLTWPIPIFSFHTTIFHSFLSLFVSFVFVFL